MTECARSKTLEMAERSLREGRLEGIIDAPKSGRWGRWVYYMRRGKQCCRSDVESRRTRTPAQGQARDAFGSAAKAWGTKLTPEQRRAWNLAATQEWSKPRLGQRGELLGEQVFAKRSSVLLKVGKEILRWPTPRPAFRLNPVAELSVTNDRDGVRIKLRVSGPVEEDIMVFGQAPCSAGRKKWRHGAYLCLLAARDGGEIDITAQYVARFGEPEPGKKVFIRTQQQKDGWKDMASDLSAVVPAKAGKGEWGVGNAECGVGAKDRGQAASVGSDGLKGSYQPHKLRQGNGLNGSDGLQQDGGAGSAAEGTEVRCTRGWFRVASASSPCHYRWRTHGGRQEAECRMQNGSGIGCSRNRHRRELWRGS